MLDIRTIEKITNGDRTIIKQFLQVFADNAAKDLTLLNKAIDDEDQRQVHYFVHKLKSSSQSIGFINGHKELQRIEDKLLLSHPIKPLRKELVHAVKECELAVVEARKLLEKYL